MFVANRIWQHSSLSSTARCFEFRLNALHPRKNITLYHPLLQLLPCHQLCHKRQPSCRILGVCRVAAVIQGSPSSAYIRVAICRREACLSASPCLPRPSVSHRQLVPKSAARLAAREAPAVSSLSVLPRQCLAHRPPVPRIRRWRMQRGEMIYYRKSSHLALIFEEAARHASCAQSVRPCSQP